MNLSRLQFGYWIFILNIILLIILIRITIKSNLDSFINYPEQIDPTNMVKSNPEIDIANNNYVSLLLFIQKYPDKSVNFIEDIRQKFFSDSKIKDIIDFDNISKLPNGLPFS